MIRATPQNVPPKKPLPKPEEPIPNQFMSVKEFETLFNKFIEKS